MVKEDGKYTSYYENGQIYDEGNYKDGKKNGQSSWYNEYGQITTKIFYDDGKPIEIKEY